MVELHVVVSDDAAKQLSERARRAATTPEELAARVVTSFALAAGADGRGSAIVGLGSSGRSDISERAEEILRVEFGS